MNHYADPPDGMATRSIDLARHFVALGHPTTIFASNFNHYRFATVERIGRFRFWRAVDIDGVRVVWIKTFRYRVNDWRRVVNMASFLVLALLAGLREQPRPDAIIGVSVHPLAALAAYGTARLRRARFFFEVTDLWPQTLIDLGRLKPNSARAVLMRRLERFLFRKAERIVMLLPLAAPYVESFGIPRDKIIWIPNGVELSRYSDLAPYEGAVRPPYRVVFMGGFVQSNAIGNILDAAKVLQERCRNDIKFSLVGRGTDRDGIIQKAKELGLNNVCFPDPVPKSDISSVMSDADVFIYALHDLSIYRYGVSLNKLTDYLAGGRPIVFSGRSAYDPVADIGAGYSVPPDDPTAIADAIEKLFSLTPSERIDMGAKGRQFVSEYHDIPKLAVRLLAALEPIA